MATKSSKSSTKVPTKRTATLGSIRLKGKSVKGAAHPKTIKDDIRRISIETPASSSSRKRHSTGSPATLPKSHPSSSSKKSKGDNVKKEDVEEGEIVGEEVEEKTTAATSSTKKKETRKEEVAAETATTPVSGTPAGGRSPGFVLRCLDFLEFLLRKLLCIFRRPKKSPRHHSEAVKLADVPKNLRDCWQPAKIELNGDNNDLDEGRKYLLPEERNKPVKWRNMINTFWYRFFLLALSRVGKSAN